MDRPVIAALAEVLRGFVQLSRSRLETMALIVVGMIGARTANLAHLVSERGNCSVALISTYRRLQRFFQHVFLPEDVAAPLIAEFAGGGEARPDGLPVAGRHQRTPGVQAQG